jgi:23S rRNA (cytidine1920-2'-O)/16S rRNA (cytidine1409-2'-O)-methyltransferase
MDDAGKTSKKRLDLWLTEQGLASSRTHAQELIEAGQVFLTKNNQKKELKKSSLSVDADMMDFIVVEDGVANRFVSRGGLKLEGALAHVKLDVQGLKALDVGISTGGFTDCLLQKGVDSVLGVDVGHGQVHKSLIGNAKLQIFEGVNARALSKEAQVMEAKPSQGFDLAVMDVSFISITLIIPEICALLKNEGLLLSLVKPQFEVGIDGLSKGGIVKDVSKYADVERKIKDLCVAQGLQILDYFSSPILGKDGNNEFFIFAKKI